jgi:hypothetical protein
MFQQTVSALPEGAKFATRTGKRGVVVRHGSGSTLVRYTNTNQQVSFTTIGGRTIEFERPGKPVTISPNTAIEPLRG